MALENKTNKQTKKPTLTTMLFGKIVVKKQTKVEIDQNYLKPTLLDNKTTTTKTTTTTTTKTFL